MTDKKKQPLVWNERNKYREAPIGEGYCDRCTVNKATTTANGDSLCHACSAGLSWED